MQNTSAGCFCRYFTEQLFGKVRKISRDSPCWSCLCSPHICLSRNFPTFPELLCLDWEHLLTAASVSCEFLVAKIYGSILLWTSQVDKMLFPDLMRSLNVYLVFEIFLKLRWALSVFKFVIHQFCHIFVSGWVIDPQAAPFSPHTITWELRIKMISHQPSRHLLVQSQQLKHKKWVQFVQS